MTRGIFKKLVAAIGASLIATNIVSAGNAIVISVPTSGSLQLLGKQVVAGVSHAVQKAQSDIRIIAVDDKCSANGAETAISNAIAELGEDDLLAVIGLLCIETTEAWHSTQLAQQAILISLNVQDGQLLPSQRSVINFTYQPNAEPLAIIETIENKWPNQQVTIVDDGSSNGRKLAATIDELVDNRNIQFLSLEDFDDLNALANQINDRGITSVFVSGASKFISDLSAATNNPEITFMTGEAPYFSPLKTLPVGLLAVAPRPLESLTSTQNVGAELKQLGHSGEGFELLGYASAQVALELFQNNAAVNGKLFNTILGVLLFDDNAQMSGLTYQLFKFDGDKFSSEETTQ